MDLSIGILTDLIWQMSARSRSSTDQTGMKDNSAGWYHGWSKFPRKEGRPRQGVQWKHQPPSWVWCKRRFWVAESQWQLPFMCEMGDRCLCKPATSAKDGRVRCISILTVSTPARRLVWMYICHQKPTWGYGGPRIQCFDLTTKRKRSKGEELRNDATW